MMNKALIGIIVLVLIVIVVIALGREESNPRRGRHSPRASRKTSSCKREKSPCKKPQFCKCEESESGEDCACKPCGTGLNSYDVERLVSNNSSGIRTSYVDPLIANAWGLSHSPTGPWNVVDNGTGLATEYLADGEPFPVGSPLQIFITSASERSSPTGNVFNRFALEHPSEFLITESNRTAPGIFFYATEDGTVSGWNSSVNSDNSILVINNSQSGAVYKGITMMEGGGARYLYVTNFSTGLVEMYDSAWTLIKTFTDPNLATNCPITGQCYAPFNIQAHCGLLYVTYALQDARHHDNVDGAGKGYVVTFDWNGTLVKRLISGGNLNAPWGLAWAPKCFGAFSCCLLVGNFGDGKINAYDTTTGQFIGTLKDQATGLSIVLEGLWGIQFGNGNQAGSKNHLYYASGPVNEVDGLFGYIKVH